MPKAASPSASANATRRRERNYAAKLRQVDNEVGNLPAIRDRALKRRIGRSLEKFLVEAFGDDIFSKPFGDVQRNAIAIEEDIIRNGGSNIQKLEPRAYGKSTRSILAAIWGILEGHVDFIMVCCDSVEKAQDLLKLASTSLTYNKVLRKCYPELKCFEHVDGNPHKARYQTYKGKRTKIQISHDTIVFPEIAGRKSSKGMLVARPYTKARGKNVEARRPDLVILDDVQSTEDAISPTTIRKYIKILSTDIAFLGSREKPAPIINNATIIAPGDFPSSIAEMKSFTTVRYKMVNEFPRNQAIWEQYQTIRQTYAADIVGDRDRARKEALQFYKDNREEMDDGSEVTWDYAFSARDHQISTIQAAMDYIADWGLEAFNSECQNMPSDTADTEDLLPVENLRVKCHPQNKNVVPADATTLVSFIDVQQDILVYQVWAYTENFGGYLIDYAPYPKQPIGNWLRRKLHAKLTNVYQNTTQEGRIKSALLDLSGALLSKDYVREGDGATMNISIQGWDARYMPDTVKSAYRDSPHKARIQLCMGYGYTAKKKPMRLRKVHTNQGEKKGFGWFLSAARHGIQILEMDTNLLKSFFHQRMSTPLNDPHSFSIYTGKTGSVLEHDLLARHWRAEAPVALVGPWGEVQEWVTVPGRPDNDYLDCSSNSAGLASFLGISMTGTEEREERKPRKKVDWSQWGG